MVGQLRLDVRPLDINPALLAAGSRLRLLGVLSQWTRWLFASGGARRWPCTLPVTNLAQVADLLGTTERFPRRLIAERPANGRTVGYGPRLVRLGLGESPLTWAFTSERVTGIEPALSAWESVQSGPSIWPDLRNGLSVSDRESPRFTRVNGPLMARRHDHVKGRSSAKAGHNPSRHKIYVRLVLSPVAAACRWSLLLLSAQVVRWQADPDRRAIRPEDWKRRGRATHYEGVTVRCSQVQSPC
jgi:hypothetical protein